MASLLIFRCLSVGDTGAGTGPPGEGDAGEDQQLGGASTSGRGVDDMYRTGQFFGLHHNLKRPLRRYAASEGNAHARAMRCTKHAYRAGKLVPGSYFMWCLDHGKCLGYFVMKDKESPKTAFEAVYCRWEEAPKGGWEGD